MGQGYSEEVRGPGYQGIRIHKEGPVYARLWESRLQEKVKREPRVMTSSTKPQVKSGKEAAH